MSQTGFNFMKVGAAAAIAAGLAVGTANAQPLVKGTFTLQHEVRWGKAVLPPGHYSIAIDDARRPALVTNTLTGERRAFVMARAVASAVKGQPTSLLITTSENERVVRSFNWSEGNQSFIYRALTSSERGPSARATETVTVPILLAEK